MIFLSTKSVDSISATDILIYMNENYTPLTPAVFHILLALSSGERHGYDIMKQVAKDSDWSVTMGPGTLYGSIKRMIEAGLITEAGTKMGENKKERIYYRLTGNGRKSLGAEINRYSAVVKIARKSIPQLS